MTLNKTTNIQSNLQSIFTKLSLLPLFIFIIIQRPKTVFLLNIYNIYTKIRILRSHSKNNIKNIE